jgi:hypothetical protein
MAQKPDSGIGASQRAKLWLLNPRPGYEKIRIGHTLPNWNYSLQSLDGVQTADE